MEDDFDEFLQYIQDEVYLPIPRNYVRDVNNPLGDLSNEEIKQTFWFDVDTIQNVLFPLVYPENRNEDNRGLPVPPLMKLCAALRFYASGGFQRTLGDLRHISQATICNIISEVTSRINQHFITYIKFPSTQQEIHNNKTKFYRIAQFPGVIGCIDGTHIEICKPGGPNPEVYRNRKGWMSLNVQVVAGADNEIFEIVIRWPDSAHDSRIFQGSAVKMKLERRQLQWLLLGDSAYAQSEFLYVPVLNPTTRQEERYNQAHIHTRNVVERTFGIWKSRFGCLSIPLRCKLMKITLIIAATAILHNIAVKHRTLNMEIQENYREMPDETPEPCNIRGNIIRNALIEKHFRHV